MARLERLRRRRASARRRQALDRCRDLGLNFAPDRRERLALERGWQLDDYRVPLVPEPPGPPVAGGSWEVAAGLMADYAFADPSIVRAFYHPDDPLEGRTMLLEAHFYGLRFLLGVRIGGVTDITRCVHGRAVRIRGMNYRTLEGHLEMGQVDYAVWKWLDSGAVEFRMHAFSKAAPIANPVVRLGFAVFGRGMQRRFARRSLERMQTLVRAG